MDRVHEAAGHRLWIPANRHGLKMYIVCRCGERVEGSNRTQVINRMIEHAVGAVKCAV